MCIALPSPLKHFGEEQQKSQEMEITGFFKKLMSSVGQGIIMIHKV